MLLRISLFLTVSVLACNCGPTPEDKTVDTVWSAPTYPMEVMPSLDQWTILLGDGTRENDLNEFAREKYFYVQPDQPAWVVYKTPNGGITSPNSHNTRTELGQKARWTPETGGKLTGTLKVMHVSTQGDARVAASYSVVVGQIHSDEGHENEPLKIFFKKFPGHEKGSLFWNYEINTEGDNDKRWDYSTPIWGYDMSTVGMEPDDYPAEPKEGIKLGEEFSYVVDVRDGIMYLTFDSKGHETKTFTKSLIESEYTTDADIPQQIRDLYAEIGRDGTEQTRGYAGEQQFFKQGAYNQTNGRSPNTNMVWSTGSNTYQGDVDQQYANGSYTEVWFRESSVSAR